MLFSICPFQLHFSAAADARFLVTFDCPKVTKGHRGLCAGPRSPTAVPVFCDTDLTEVGSPNTSQPEPPLCKGRWVPRTRRDCVFYFALLNFTCLPPQTRVFLLLSTARK